MDLKYSESGCERLDAQFYTNMYVNLMIVVPMLLLLLIYLVITVKNNLNLKANLQLNIVYDDDNVKKREDIVDKKKYHVPKFMLDLYEKNKIFGKTYKTADVVKSLIPKRADLIHDSIVVEELIDNHLLVFDIPSSNEDEHFVDAELKILTIIEANSEQIKRKLKLSIFDDDSQIFELKEEEIEHKNNTWLSFNVTKAVLEVLEKETDNKYLKIVITIKAYFAQERNSFRLSLMPTSKDFDHEYPILLLSYISKEENGTKVKRRKRSLEEDYEEETNNVWDDEVNKKLQMKKIRKFRNSCRRKPLYINFAEIKYDVWILQPTGYEAYQCQGRCFYPVAEHLNPTKHAIVQALLHSVAPARVARSCCVPTLLDSISILYVDHKGVLTYRYAYKDMVVKECGCR